ncbi:MAG TPA: DNA-processing protein DprA [Micromonosporaceae bacterium]
MTGTPDARGVGGPELSRLARIALGHLVEPGSRELGQLVADVGPVHALRALQPGAPGWPRRRGAEVNADNAVHVPARLAERVRVRLGSADPFRLAEQALERAGRIGARIVTPEDEEWPYQLADLVWLSRDAADPIYRDTHPPHCLWVRGPWPLSAVCERSVAVVGARASTAYGDHMAGELGFGLADRGWTVVSGGAFGIDAAAHRGALAAGGPTVAVLACGVDRPYPLSHASLFAQIAEDGLLVTEWPPGSDPHKRRFLVRNRVIAAMSRGTVMVEANVRSGARFTLNRARDLHRHVLAVPGPATSAMSAGCHEELRVPGTVLVTGAAQVLDVVGRIGADLAPPARAEESARDQLTPLQQQVLDGVRPRKVLTAEEIAAAAGVSTRDARRTLPGLELAGFVTATGAGYRLWRKSDPKPLVRSGSDG